MLNPYTFRTIGVGEVSRSYVESLFKNVPYLAALVGKEAIMQQLLGELPTYFAHAENVPYEVNVLEWWFEKRNVLPSFYNVILQQYFSHLQRQQNEYLPCYVGCLEMIKQDYLKIIRKRQ